MSFKETIRMIIKPWLIKVIKVTTKFDDDHLTLVNAGHGGGGGSRTNGYEGRGRCGSHLAEDGVDDSYIIRAVCLSVCMLQKS